MTYLIVLLVPSFMIGILSYQSAKNANAKELMNSALESTKSADNIISQNIQAKMNDIEYLLKQPHLERAIGDPLGKGGELKLQLREYMDMHSDVKDVVLGIEGGYFVRASEDPLPQQYDVTKQNWYIQSLKQGDKPVVSPVFQAANGKMAVSISQAAPSGKGVLSIELNLDNIRTLTNMKLGNKGYIFITDQDQNYVVHPKYTGKKAEGEFLKPLYGKSEGNFSYTFENEERRLAFTTNRLTGWKVAGSMFEADIEASAHGIRNSVIIVMTASILAALAIIFLNVRSIIRPISKLTQATERISQGDLTARIDTSSRDEIGHLSRHFQAMVDNLRSMIVNVQEITGQVSLSAKGLSTSADQTTQAIETVTEAIQEVAAGSEQQLRSVEQSMGSMDIMSTQSERIRTHMDDASSKMERTTRSAEEGNAAVEDVTGKMGEIHATVHELDEVVMHMSERTGRIGEIVTLMAEIAKQTNLLALNAPSRRRVQVSTGKALRSWPSRSASWRNSPAIRRSASKNWWRACVRKCSGCLRRWEMPRAGWPKAWKPQTLRADRSPGSSKRFKARRKASTPRRKLRESLRGTVKAPWRRSAISGACRRWRPIIRSRYRLPPRNSLRPSKKSLLPPSI
ncbi:Methyl-accepting chemotaxis protein McpB [Paenibacillus sp. P1XP2]|nr:Methyl-accepting chemotaxis protein McpB [Paenibacillus sp. P1XP2]